MCKMAFDDKIDCEYCYDNYIYNRGEARQVQVFDVYDLTTKLGIIYVSLAEYSNLLISNKPQRLLAGNPPRDPRKVAK